MLLTDLNHGLLWVLLGMFAINLELPTPSHSRRCKRGLRNCSFCSGPAGCSALPDINSPQAIESLWRLHNPPPHFLSFWSYPAIP